MPQFTLACQTAPAGILIRAEQLPGWATQITPGHPAADLFRQILTEMEIVAYAHKRGERSDLDVDVFEETAGVQPASADKREYWANRRRADRANGVKRGVCGTRSGYVGLCRCGPCKAANAAYEQARKARVSEQTTLRMVK